MYYLQNILIFISILIIIFIIIFKSKYTNETFENYNNFNSDISELRRDIQNHYSEMNNYRDDTHMRFTTLVNDIDNNNSILVNTNRKLTDYESIFGKFVENSTIPPVDTIKLCNSNKECVEMNYDNEYNIKSNNIKIKNNNNEIITHFNNNDIYFGGENENAPLYIKKGKNDIENPYYVYSDKLYVSDLYIKDYNDNSNFLAINDYIKLNDDIIKISQDNNNNINNNINKLEIKLENHISNMQQDRERAIDREDENSRIISGLNFDNQNYENLNSKFLNMYNELSTDLTDNIAEVTRNNINFQNYQQLTNNEIVKLNEKIDDVTYKLLHAAALQTNLYNKINDNETPDSHTANI